MAARGTCPACGRDGILINAGGALRRHADPERSGSCPGSHDLAAEDARRGDALRPYEDLLASIWLYIPWQYVTKQLTTPQKEMFADAIDAAHARRDAEESEPDGYLVERWWRDG